MPKQTLPVSSPCCMPERATVGHACPSDVVMSCAARQENKGKGVAGNSLWPATVVESLASENFEMGDKARCLLVPRPSARPPARPLVRSSASPVLFARGTSSEPGPLFFGFQSMWRKATVLSDVVCHIVSRSPHDCTNNMCGTAAP